MFSRCFAIPKEGKSKETFGNRGQKVGKLWACVAAFLGALGACLGAGRGFPGASAQVVHQHTKIAAFLLFGAIAFLHPFNKSVLRAF